MAAPKLRFWNLKKMVLWFAIWLPMALGGHYVVANDFVLNEWRYWAIAVPCLWISISAFGRFEKIVRGYALEAARPGAGPE